MAEPRLFDPAAGPRLYAEPPGADFPARVAEGLRARLAGQPPEAMAKVEIITNSAGMLNSLRQALLATGPGFLPQLKPVTDPTIAWRPGHLPPAQIMQPPAPSLRRRLELAQLVRRLIEAEPDLAPRAAAFSLAESLAALMDEMQAEDVPFAALDELDVSEHSAHWARALGFLRLVARYLGPDAAPDQQRRQRLAVEALIAHWQTAAPAHPVLVVGSTGSRGATAALMRAVARLPQGAAVLPGFDFDMPAEIWESLDDALHGEDHPQFRHAALLRALALAPGDVSRWSGADGPAPARARLLSMALHPPPVTDRWRAEGPSLGDLTAATEGLSLIEAPTPRAEALAIALALRDAAARGQRAVLVTPDRRLARQVTAALDRWHLRPDDSAGRPLSLSASGRFLRHVAALMAGPPSGDALLILLKHPITHSGAGRGEHLLLARDLEHWLRRRGLSQPTPADMARWAGKDAARQRWAGWLEPVLTPETVLGEVPLGDWLKRHRALAEYLARGAEAHEGDEASGTLWREAPGEAARAVLDDLAAEAVHGGTMAQFDYGALIDRLLGAEVLRESVAAHPLIAIHGIREARELTADLVVLGGLNEGTWPALPTPDPWLNRQMRLQAGLLLPERQIGLAAHDFQHAACAPRVALSRARRDAEAETVPARWLNRLLNLVGGLPEQGGGVALDAMRARGRHWLDTAAGIEADTRTLPPGIGTRNPRPAPAPPARARPQELPVTAIKQLIRDPYHIYARHVLGLELLDPLAPAPDARLRGTVLHRLLEHYVLAHPPGTPAAPSTLLHMAGERLAAEVPAPAVRHFWLARLARSATDFARWNAALEGRPELAEVKGALTLTPPGFTLVGKPDRIDRLPDGALAIYDYKTGQLPSARQQQYFDKQLILLAMMAEAGAFSGLGAAPVAEAAFVGVGTGFDISPADVSAASLDEHGKRLARLIENYLDPGQGYTARRAMKADSDASPYDGLARLGEWEVTDEAETIPVGRGSDD